MRVTGLTQYGLQVPSLEAAESFYVAFGLEAAQESDVLRIRSSGRDMDQVVLSEGPRKRLHFVTFSVGEGTLTSWARHLEAHGVQLVDAPSGAVERGLWFRDPDQTFVNLRDEPVPSSRTFDDVAKTNVDGAYNRIDEARWLTADAAARPRRLSHMLIFSSDIAASEQFYARTLGLRVSDRIVGRATFMNSGPGDHHVFGFIQSSHPGLHHSSWEVANLDQLGVGAQQMAAAGHHEGWGLGRHTLGSNLFHYVRDPWGSWIEYTTDMDQITEQWRPNDWDIPPAVWCPMMPPEFLDNHEDKP